MAVFTYSSTSIFMYSKKYRNKKKGTLYELLNDSVINCTNANDGQIMVMYKSLDNPKLIFVREKQEFFVKFEEV